MAFLDKIFSKNKSINNVFFKGVLLPNNSGYVLSEDSQLIAKYKNFLNSYLSGIEFPVVIDEILDVLDVNVSDCYIIGNIFYNERQENGIWQKEEIDLNSNSNWISKCPRYGNIGFKFSDGYSFESYYAIQISSIQEGIKLYRGYIGLEGMETLISSYSIDCTVGDNISRIKLDEADNRKRLH